MGIIVTLPPPRRKRVSAVPTTNEATILLFMGVRYVRELETEITHEIAPATMPERTADCPPLETA
jgi:hypothetical protein